MKPSGLYIHIPYCKSKCIYCDFFSGGDGSADWNTLTKALLGEFKERRGELVSDIDTIYIGGGTPSLMPGKEFERLVEGLVLSEGIDVGKLSEFTVEVNPEDVTEDKCIEWRDCGVTRVSMGVQSLNDDELKVIRRRHNAETALKSLLILKKHFDNVTCDLMFGLPCQTVNSWKETIMRLLDYQPQHISAYSLMFEERTPLTMFREKGILNFPEEEECVEMWRLLSCVLKENGFRQYEISNYALAGYESVHNKRYWLGNPYLGIGPSAHSYDGNRVRRSNPSKLKEYMMRFAGFSHGREERSPFYTEERLDNEELAEEMIMLRMRMNSGLDLEEYKGRFGNKMLSRLVGQARPFIEDGSVLNADGRLRLTDKGIMVADEIIVNLAM